MDCSKTINFLSELKKLCDSEDATRVIEIMQKWSDEQPKKHTHRTYLKNENEKGR